MSTDRDNNSNDTDNPYQKLSDKSFDVVFAIASESLESGKPSREDIEKKIEEAGLIEEKTDIIRVLRVLEILPPKEHGDE